MSPEVEQQAPDGVGWWWVEVTTSGTVECHAVRMRDTAGYLWGQIEGWTVDLDTPGLRWRGRVAPPGGPTAEEHARVVAERDAALADLADVEAERDAAWDALGVGPGGTLAEAITLLARGWSDRCAALTAELVERVFADDRPCDALAGLPLPGARRPLEAAAVRERVEAILDAMPDHWQASWHALLELLPLCELGDQHLEHGEVDAARTVWLTIARTVQQRYPALRDEERELSGLIVDCARDLGRCLDASDAGLSRQLLIEDLAALWWWDAVEQDSVGVHPPIADVLTLHLDPDERHQLAAHLLARLELVDAMPGARGE